MNKLYASEFEQCKNPEVQQHSPGKSFICSACIKIERCYNEHPATEQTQEYEVSRDDLIPPFNTSQRENSTMVEVHIEQNLR